MTSAGWTTAQMYTAPTDTNYNNTSDWAKDYGQAFSTFFSTELDQWTLNFQSRSVWHVDETNEWTVDNANVYYPTSAYAVPTSLIRRQFNNVRNGHRYNYADLNLNRTFGTDRFSDTVLIGADGGSEGFFNSRLGFGPNSTVAQAITLIDPTLDQYGYPPLGTGVSANQVRQSALGEYLSDQIRISDLVNIFIRRPP